MTDFTSHEDGAAQKTFVQPSMLSVEQLVTESFAIYKRSFGVLFALSLFCSFIQTFVQTIFRFFDNSFNLHISRAADWAKALFASEASANIASNRIELIVLAMLSSVLLFIILRFAYQRYVYKRSACDAFVRSCRPQPWQLINSVSVSCLLMVFVFLGMMVLILPGLVIYAFGVLAMPVVSLEGLAIKESFLRGRDLARGYAFKLCFFLILFFAFVLSFAIAVPYVCNHIASVLSGVLGIGGLSGTALQLKVLLLDELLWPSLVTPLGGIFLMLVYVNIRLAKQEYFDPCDHFDPCHCFATQEI